MWNVYAKIDLQWKDCSQQDKNKDEVCCYDNQTQIHGSLEHSCSLVQATKTEWSDVTIDGEQYWKCERFINGKVVKTTADNPVDPQFCMNQDKQSVQYGAIGEKENKICLPMVKKENKNRLLEKRKIFGLDSVDKDINICSEQDPDYNKNIYVLDGEGKCAVFAKRSNANRLLRFIGKKLFGLGKCKNVNDPKSIDCFIEKNQNHFQGYAPVNNCLTYQRTDYGRDKDGNCVEYVESSLESIQLKFYEKKKIPMSLINKGAILGKVNEDLCLKRDENGRIIYNQKMGQMVAPYLVEKTKEYKCALYVETLNCPDNLKVCSGDFPFVWIKKFDLPLGECFPDNAQARKTVEIFYQGKLDCWECGSLASNIPMDSVNELPEIDGNKCIPMKRVPKVACEIDRQRCEGQDSKSEFVNVVDASKLVVSAPIVKSLHIAQKQSQLLTNVLNQAAKQGGVKVVVTQTSTSQPSVRKTEDKSEVPSVNTTYLPQVNKQVVDIKVGYFNKIYSEKPLSSKYKMGSWKGLSLDKAQNRARNLVIWLDDKFKETMRLRQFNEVTTDDQERSYAKHYVSKQIVFFTMSEMEKLKMNLSQGAVSKEQFVEKKNEIIHQSIIKIINSLTFYRREKDDLSPEILDEAIKDFAKVIYTHEMVLSDLVTSQQPEMVDLYWNYLRPTKEEFQKYAGLSMLIHLKDLSQEDRVRDCKEKVIAIDEWGIVAYDNQFERRSRKIERIDSWWLAYYEELYRNHGNVAKSDLIQQLDDKFREKLVPAVTTLEGYNAFLDCVHRDPPVLGDEWKRNLKTTVPKELKDRLKALLINAAIAAISL